MKRRRLHPRAMLWTALGAAVVFTAAALYLRDGFLAGRGRPGVDDLPLVEYPVSGPSRGDLMAVVMSGDGGWSPIARNLSSRLARAGIPVVGWNSLRYYWHPRSPQEASEDLQKIVDVYGPRWHRRRVLLVGVSFGADALPFLVNLLPAQERGQVAGVALLSFGRDAAFEFHLRDWLRARPPTRYFTIPEARRLAGTPLLCVYGTGDDVTRVGCPLLRATGAHVVQLPGGHDFAGDYARVAALVVPRRNPAGGLPGYRVRARIR
ncbi:MAG: virulence protein [Gemmatimonadetes bacterium]|nr:virulence protein [Gemmatimonadota bacterium]